MLPITKIPFQRVHTTDLLQDQIQHLPQRTAVVVNTTPFANGVLVKQQTIAVGDTTIRHSLGRVPVGYIEVRRYSGSSIATTFAESGASPMTATTATFATGGPGSVTVDLYFF